MCYFKIKKHRFRRVLQIITFLLLHFHDETFFEDIFDTFLSFTLNKSAMPLLVKSENNYKDDFKCSSNLT